MKVGDVFLNHERDDGSTGGTPAVRIVRLIRFLYIPLDILTLINFEGVESSLNPIKYILTQVRIIDQRLEDLLGAGRMVQLKYINSGSSFKVSWNTLIGVEIINQRNFC